MASKRAKEFAEALFHDLCEGRNRHFWGTIVCEAKANDVRIADVIAEALDAYLGAYQAEAWNTITDSPTSWPKNNAHVVLSTGKFGPCEGWVQNGVWYVVGHGALRDRPTKWTPLPEDPENP